MRKERIIATIVIPVLTFVVTFLTFLFGQEILQNLGKGSRPNDQANIIASEPSPDDNPTEPLENPSGFDSNLESTTQSGGGAAKPQKGASHNQSVTVPNLLNTEQMEATDTLKSLGLQFQVWWTEENNVDSDVYYIIDQSIHSGSTVPAGSMIRLKLSAKKP